MNLFEAIHENALRCARQYQRAEGALIDALQKVDNKKIYSKMGYASLFDYSIGALKLSESTAYAFIRVARKCVEIPEMKVAIDAGRLSVPQAKRIAAVITPGTQAAWIDKATELTQRELDREIAKEMPEKAIAERIIPKSAGRLKLEFGISEELEKEIRRVQDVLSQKTQRAVTLEEALGVLCKEYLKRNDPMEVAMRSQMKQKQRVSKPVGKNIEKGQGTQSTADHIALPIQHQVRLKTGGRCTAPLPSGGRCEAKRWLEMHHIIMRKNGGLHSVDNLTLLCSSHHRALHERAMV